LLFFDPLEERGNLLVFSKIDLDRNALATAAVVGCEKNNTRRGTLYR
jgi:hypothetical protein